jgi:hypothetical protein
MDPHCLPDLDELEDRFRGLISEADLRQPDAVQKDAATGELTFFWHDRGLVVVVGPDGELSSGSAEPPGRSLNRRSAASAG